MSLKVALISPGYNNRDSLFWNLSYALKEISKRVDKPVKSPTYSMALPIIAALIQKADKHARIQIIDENVSELEAAKLKPDLVCITAHTMQIKRAFQIAHELKKEHPPVKILLGGAHIGNTRDDEIIKEALSHVDTVVVGESDNLWTEILSDLGENNLKDVYLGNNNIAQLNTLLLPRFDLLALDAYLFRNMEASRGCNRRCSFCNVATNLRFKDPDNVVAEIKYLREIEHQQGTEHRSIFFTDSLLNPLGHEDEIKTLMEKLIRYKEQKYLGDDLHWFGQVNSQVGMKEFDELLGLMARAGARQLLIGFEGFYFDKHGKKDKGLSIAQRKKSFYDTIKKVRAKGMDVFGSFVIGFDDETSSVFTELEDFINESGLVLAQIALRTPFPGTRDFRGFRQENRLIKNGAGYDWNKYTGANFVFTPKQNLEHKQNEYYKLLKRVFSDDSVRQRVKIRQEVLPYGPAESFAEMLYVKSFQAYAHALSPDENTEGTKGISSLLPAANN